MGLVQHAEAELRRAGFYDKDSDYGGMLAEAVVELIKKFAEQGHSGGSAMATLALFERLARFQTLTPLTADAAEWEQVPQEIQAPGSAPLWQSKRDPSYFSDDGGKTWWNNSGPQKARG